MKLLIDLLQQKDKQRWLTTPRFAVVFLPLGFSAIFSSVGYNGIAILSFALVAVGFSRLVWFKLWPHEAVRLSSARKALAAARSDEAIQLLQASLRFAGVYYTLERAVLLSKAYAREGMFIEAHDILNSIDKKNLLPIENNRLHCAWAQLFRAAGNPDEAARRLESVSANDYAEDAEFLLTKVLVALDLGQLIEARQILEAELDRKPKDDFRILLLNNLAVVERMQGRTDRQIRHLQAARAIFRQVPRADLTSILHHNLAIALARAGQSNEAREVLREAWAAGDSKNLAHVLEVLNNCLHAAREIGDQNWKHEIYEEFDRQLMHFDSVSPREQLALDVTQLRMRRNDGVPIESSVYAALVIRLLDDLDKPQIAISESDRVAALREIWSDVKCQIETQYASVDFSELLGIMRRASVQLLAKRAIVDAYLNTLSPKLTGPVDLWHRYQTNIDKAEIFLATTDEARYVGLDHLFRHLHEKAEWLSEQNLPRQSVEAWLILCDEYISYDDKLPEYDKKIWSERYRDLAESALDKALAITDASNNPQNHVDHLIGIAWTALRLRSDVATASRCIAVVKKFDPAPDHFAVWLRNQYQWVLEQIKPSMSAIK